MIRNPATGALEAPACYFLTAAAGAAAVACAAFCGAGDFQAGVSAGIAVLGIAAALILQPPIETVLLVWFFTTPLLAFFIHLPSDHPLITFDRAAFAIVAALMATRGISGRAAESTAASRFEVLWALLSAIALASAATQSNNSGYSLRIAVDSFCLPLVAFYATRRHFETRGRGHILLAGAAAVALFLFATGAYELLLRRDLFPFEGAQLIRENEIRVNGPFQSDSSFAVICLMLAVFLRAAPSALSVKLDRGGRIIHWSAVTCAAIASLFPLYRVVGAALLVSWIIVEAAISTRRDWTSLRSPRTLAAAAIFLAVLAGGALLIEGSSQGGRLSSARNVYSRVATWEAGLGIVLDRPLFGAGLTNYHDYFNLKYSRADQWMGSIENARPIAYPHSNALWVAAELGVPAFALYAIANIYLLLIGYRGLTRAATAQQRTAAGCFLGLLAAYWIPGSTLTSGVYSDLNLYFFFLLGLLSTRFLAPGPVD